MRIRSRAIEIKEKNLTNLQQCAKVTRTRRKKITFSRCTLSLLLFQNKTMPIMDFHEKNDPLGANRHFITPCLNIL